jgi:hypothetical protein
VVEGLEFVTGRGVGSSRGVKGPSAPYVYLYAKYKSKRYPVSPSQDMDMHLTPAGQGGETV